MDRKSYVKIALKNNQWLYLSSAHHAKKSSGSKRKGLKYSEGKGNIPRVDIQGLFHGVNEDSPQNSLPGWVGAADKIDSLFKSPQSVLNKGKRKVWLHCKHGKSRTAYIATTYLMRHHNLSYDDAKKHVIQQMSPLHGGVFDPDIKSGIHGSYDSWAKNNNAFIKGSSDKVRVSVPGLTRRSNPTIQEFPATQKWGFGISGGLHWPIKALSMQETKQRGSSRKIHVGLPALKKIGKKPRRMRERRINRTVREGRQFIGPNLLPRRARYVAGFYKI